MSSDPLKAAEEQIAQHRASIARLEEFVRMYHTLSGRTSPVGNPASIAVSTPAPHTRPEPLRPHESQQEQAFTSTAAVNQAAVEILRGAGRALAASEIFDLLTANGVRIAGKNPKGNLTAKFAQRRDLFQYSSETGKWSLQEWSQAAESAASWSGQHQLPTEAKS